VPCVYKVNLDEKHKNWQIGRQGQGPGEFMGLLRVSIGNNGKLYITDNVNRRISVVDKNGKLINSYNIPSIYNEKVIADSSGNQYLFSPNGFNIVDIYNKTLVYLKSAVDIVYISDYQEIIPPDKYRKLLKGRIDTEAMHKMIDRNNDLYLVLNNSRLVVCFDQEGREKRIFRINNKSILNEMKKRIGNINNSEAWINAFGAVFIDNEGMINLCFYNESLTRPEVYRYSKEGQYYDTLIADGLAVRTNRLFASCDSNGRYYRIDRENMAVITYKREGKARSMGNN
jgi:hypothetical protein